MKKLIIIMLGVMLLASCESSKNEYVPVEQIQLNQTTLDLMTDDTFQLEAKILPENATDQSIKWVSSDNRLATVDQNGLVTSLMGGTCTIMAKSPEGITSTCTITSTQRYIPIEEIIVTPSEQTLHVGYAFKVEVKIMPLNATNQMLTATIPGRDIIDMTPMGEVIAVAPGVAEIIFSVDGEEVVGKCKVTVIE